MPDIPNISNINLFAEYAQNNFKRWRTTIGTQVEHTTYGIGKIKDVITRSENIHIEICFINHNGAVITFPYNTFSDIQFFVNMELPFKGEWLSEQILSDAQRRVEQLQQIAERASLEKEEQQKIDLIKKQRMEEEAHKLLAAEKEKKRRIEEVNLARERHEKEKQNLLHGLRKEFEQNFLYAYNFYHDNCSKHISSSEYQSEKNNYVRYWLKNHLNYEPEDAQSKSRTVQDQILNDYSGR